VELVRRLAGDGTTVILTTHYMDEAEALADQVSIIASGKIVAHGPPSSLGGRDQGAATIRFQLPAGVEPADLPVAVVGDGPPVELRTDSELEALYELTRWALEHGVRLTGLDRQSSRLQAHTDRWPIRRDPEGADRAVDSAQLGRRCS
jgi:ABC-2 type transport system ATP-binding protein